MADRKNRRNIQSYCVERVLNKLDTDERDELKGIYEMGLTKPWSSPTERVREAAVNCAREWAKEHSRRGSGPRRDVAYHAGLTVAYALSDPNDVDDLMSCIEHFVVACGYDTYDVDAAVHLGAKVKALQEIVKRALT